MSNAAINPSTALLPDAGHGHDNHDPHLAHHFDTPEQQYISSKLGMWVFLGTEILMFGGLFCAYSVYRHNHPEVFEFAHQFLDKKLGAINTIVLITSSLTMAWGVRAAQMGKQVLLLWLLAATILGGFGFMAIKSVEYHHKWEHHLWFGERNKYNANYKPGAGVEPEHQDTMQANVVPAQPGVAAGGHRAPEVGQEPSTAHLPGPATAPSAVAVGAGGAVDPNAGTDDAAKIVPNFKAVTGLAPEYFGKPKAAPELDYTELDVHDQARVSTFFSIYFIMTGLHGIHVIVGMSLIFWVLMRAAGTKAKAWSPPLGLLSVGLFLIFVGKMIESHGTTFTGVGISVLSVLWLFPRLAAASKVRETPGEFGPKFFTPVDLVGLYWHIVDMIWIFLFPLLYLIH